MSSPLPRCQKILNASLCILLLSILPGSCLATTYNYSYELIEGQSSSSYRLTVSVTETLYKYYRSKDHNLDYYDFSKFVTPDVLKPVADDLWSIYNNEEDFANGVLMIVHQITYEQSDPQKYPVETIVENAGDCDLLSIMASSIMKAGGLDVVLLLLEYDDHMLVGVHLPESPNYARTQVYFCRYEGKKYYLAETTGGEWERGWRVGECPETLQSSSAKIISLENYEMSAPGQVSSSYSIPDSSSIYMSLSSNFAIDQDTVEIKGSISPSLSGETITFYVSSLGSPLTMLATVVTGNTGQYHYTWYSPPGGIHSVRAHWSGDDMYNSADSGTLRLVVIPTEYLVVGVILILFLVILLIVTLTTRRGKSENLETLEDHDFADYPQDF